MRAKRNLVALATVLGACGAASCEEPKAPVAPMPSSSSPVAQAGPPSKEPHLADPRQLTFGGENAEAYWANSGKELIMQARSGDQQCDRIYRMNVLDPKQLVPVSSGKGATTCSYFLPGDQDVIYASTHGAGDACPPRPGHEHGYTWALYSSYDIYRAKADGSGVVKLTDTPGYDAEGTVCRKDGSIVFTSVRNGDIDLYRMDADGKNVKQLTHEPGYDGGAFFSDDCTKLVWRASRPKGKDLEEYKSLLAQGLVRPTKLEIMVGNADGSDPVQLTYLDAASFAPYFFPDHKRILFSSNYGDPKGREFDIWGVNVDGTQLEKVTNTAGFDGFPMFSPDGKTLAFSSNRGSKPDSHDTNVFVAQWVDGPPVIAEETGADRTLADDRWLADPAREGRGVGTKGLDDAGAYIEKRMKDLGLAPAVSASSYRQSFDVAVSMTGDATLEVDGAPIAGTVPLAFSSNDAGLEAELVLADYGIDGEGRNDYKGLDVKGKIVVVRRFVPDDAPFDTSEAKRRHGDFRRKAWVAREKGAKGIIVVDLPTRPKKADKAWKLPDEAKLPGLNPDGESDAGIAAVVATRASMSVIVDKLAKKQHVKAKLEVALTPQKKSTFNVVGRLAAKGPKQEGTIVIGAHYDHLGKGGYGSLAPGEEAVHPGADDNGSGVSTILEAAKLVAAGPPLSHDVVFAAFSGEERGLLGSSFLVKNPLPGLAPKDIVAMINLDMVGRMRGNHLDVIGHDTATEFADIVKGACGKARIDCNLGGGGGYGPSDHASFYAAGVPVLFLFSGTHGDYHKPSDTADKINAAGMGQTAVLVREILGPLDALKTRPAYQKVASPPPKGDTRSFGASLGTVPDYAAPGGPKGVLLSGVRPGGAADLAGVKGGDLLIKIGKHDLTSVQDLAFALGDAKPGEKTKLVLMRAGKRLELDATFQESKAPPK